MCGVLDKLMPIAHRYVVQMRCCGDKGLVGYPITRSGLAGMGDEDAWVWNGLLLESRLEVVEPIKHYKTS